MRTDRALSTRALFSVVYTTAVSSLYFALGVVAHRALDFTPVVFALGAFFFALTAMTYVEGASMYREPGGSTVFSRYAFNELFSFVSGWVVVLDYVILVAVASVAATNYLGTFWGPFGHGALEVVVALGIIAFAAIANVAGLPARFLQARSLLAVFDLGLQFLIIVIGAFLVLDPSTIVHGIHLGSRPRWEDALFALTLATVAFAGLEAAAGLSSEVRVRARDLRRLVLGGTLIIATLYVGIAAVGISALPVHGHMTDLGGRYIDRPLVGVAAGLKHGALADILRYTVAAAAVVTLVGAANSAMLGVSRVALSLATNRQIPRVIGRLHPSRGTPWIVILLTALLAAGLAAPTDVDLLVGIYAFGAMLAFSLAHISIIVLRFRAPEHRRPFRIPLSFALAGRSVPAPAVLGAVMSLLGFGAVIALHSGARYVGIGWLVFGLILYTSYRLAQGTPMFERISVPERALRVAADELEPEFGSILVPVFGGELDVDIVQTAGRLAGDERDDLESEGAIIEALWVFEVPMALPLDARLPDAQLRRARDALARAKAVGEEYEGVEVATATVRARRTGQAIVDEARRRGVEAIVLAAEPPSRVRGGLMLGGRGGPLDDYVGDVTKYVLRKAACRVILTAPASETAAS